MKIKVTLDSSVIVSGLLIFEPRYQESVRILKKVFEGEYLAILPSIVLVEVVSAIKRRTNSEILALKVKEKLLNSKFIEFVDVNFKIMNESAELAAKLGLRGMDTIIVEVSRENNSKLITYDKEILEKLKTI
jgi:predicted nucleic acid-binding protein